MLLRNWLPLQACIHLNAYGKPAKKNNFDYGFSMEFDSVDAYEAYNQHPDHVAFVETFWKKDVADFLEVDYEPLQ